MAARWLAMGRGTGTAVGRFRVEDEVLVSLVHLRNQVGTQQISFYRWRLGCRAASKCLNLNISRSKESGLLSCSVIVDRYFFLIIYYLTSIKSFFVISIKFLILF
ncbi:hypothetical protein KFK09_016459 [Dendrobium nobile]|uniref:Uncharacterized protein n=1 Tax=Dendrobium nobile TaxID=94219 RepID=A0A8T3AZM3_DENNO|nr:hypothetical protein KFK09_016459 [Dendrobium nobile]